MLTAPDLLRVLFQRRADALFGFTNCGVGAAQLLFDSRPHERARTGVVADLRRLHNGLVGGLAEANSGDSGGFFLHEQRIVPSVIQMLNEPAILCNGLTR